LDPRIATFVGATTVATAAAAAVYRSRWVGACRLYFRRFPSVAGAPFLRKADVAMLAMRLRASHPPNETFMVVYGPKGVGKTTTIGAAMANVRGVVHVDVSPCLEVKEIEELVYEALWPHALSGEATIKRQVEALKVVKTYTRFFSPPWVVLNVAEEKGNVSGKPIVAARCFCKDGLNVIVNATGTAITKFCGGRAQPVLLDYMDWDDVRHIPQLQHTLKKLEDANLVSLVKAVVGGCPLELEALQFPADVSPHGVRMIVNPWLTEKLATAARKVHVLRVTLPESQSILQHFETQDRLPFEECRIPAEKLQAVFREKEGFFVPHSAAIAFVLRHNIVVSKAKDFIVEWRGGEM